MGGTNTARAPRDTQGRLTARADRAFSELIRSRGFCQAAGLDDTACRGFLQCAHIVTRKNYAVRWDTLNALCLCEAHHLYYTHRGRDLEWPLLVQRILPQARFMELVYAARASWDGSREIRTHTLVYPEPRAPLAPV